MTKDATKDTKNSSAPSSSSGSSSPSEEKHIVRDVGKWEWSQMFKTEDWWAVWIGFAILIAGMLVYFPHTSEMENKILEVESKYSKAAERTDAIKTIAWYQLSDARKGVKAKKIDAGKWLSKLTKKPHGWSTNPLDSLFVSSQKAQGLREKALEKYNQAKNVEKNKFLSAQIAEAEAETAFFKDTTLNLAASNAIGQWRNAQLKAKSAKKKTKIKSHNQIFYLIVLGIFLMILFSIGIGFMGESVPKFMLGFTFIYGLTLLAWIGSYQSTMKHYGIGYAAWGIIIGLLISNTIGTPKWAMAAVRTEYYIKTGLVLLGAKILFEKIVTIGSAGIFVAWVVTPIVWVVTYWFGQKIIRIPSKRLNATICSDMSVCGVSAAVATAAACRAKKEELTLAIGISMIFTSVMMVVMPLVIKGFFPVDKQLILGGAWMGGTIDATGAVAAAGAFLGEKALHVAATIKMIQNILIGVIAFFVAFYFTTKVEAAETGQKIGLMEIWYRFPKFVIGFVGASILFSLLYSHFNAQTQGLGYAMIDQGIVKGMSDLFRSWFFTLSFVSIGLATNFRELKHHLKGGKPLLLYISGQTLNLVLTLVVAYVVFYVIFPDLTATI